MRNTHLSFCKQINLIIFNPDTMSSEHLFIKKAETIKVLDGCHSISIFDLVNLPFCLGQVYMNWYVVFISNTPCSLQRLSSARVECMRCNARSYQLISLPIFYKRLCIDKILI